MADSTLATTWDELRMRTAYFRGFGTDPAEWDQQQKDILEMCLRSGARLFYKPGPIGGAPHEWSFLRPPFELLLPDGVDDVDLPADFGFLIGDLYYVGDGGSACPLQMKNDAKIFKLRQMNPDSSGRPECGAIVPGKKPGSFAGQRFTLMLYPTPGQDYTVVGRYSVLPAALDTTHKHPYGGAAHGETWIQACLAASEQIDGTPGPATAHFQERLAASIQYDRRAGAQSIDNEDGPYKRRGADGPYASLTTYQGLYSA